MDMTTTMHTTSTRATDCDVVEAPGRHACVTARGCRQLAATPAIDGIVDIEAHPCGKQSVQPCQDLSSVTGAAATIAGCSTAGGSPTIWVVPRNLRQRLGNMLPSDNVYTKTLARASSEYESLGWAVRVAGCRMLTPGVLEIAFAVPGGPDGLQSSLDRIPGVAEVQSVAEKCVAFAHHQIVPAYFTESTWEATSAEWAYND